MDGTCTSGRELRRRKGFHTLGSPFAGGDCGWRRQEASEPRRRAQPQGWGGQSGEVPAQRICADHHSPAQEACLLSRRGGRGWELRLGLRSDPRERTGVGSVNTAWRGFAPQLVGGESGKKSGAAEEARDFFLPLCFLVREERGAPPKRAPETGVSRGYQRGPQRRAWDAKAAAATTKKPVCEHRSLSTPPLPGAYAAHHCQGPGIQGQLPRENARCASGWCNVTPASAATGSPRIRTPPSPRPEWARAPEAAAPLTPSCVSKEQMPSGDLHAEAGPNPKLNPRSCANKEQKGKLLPAASGAAD